MVSKTSVISFVVVLLVASSYSAPIDKQPDSSKLDVKQPIEKPVVIQPDFSKETIHHKKKSSDEKDSDELTTQDITRPTRESDSKESDEVTTERINRPVRVSESKESDEVTTEIVTRPPREIESEEVTTERINRPIRILESKESDEITTEVFTRPTRQSDDTRQPIPTGDDYKRAVEDFVFTTLESSTNFNKRAIRPIESKEVLDTSSPIPSDKKKKSVDDEPSSIQVFGKSTGLLKDESKERPNEETDKESSEKDQRVKKTISIIPDKITETKIDIDSPSKKSVVVEPIEQEQLSQVQHKPNIEKTKSDN